MKYYCVSLFILFTTLSSFLSSNKIEPIKQGNVLNDTVFFDYSTTGNQMFFRGLVNDTIETKIFFDTGLPIDEFIVSDSLQQHLKDTSSITLWYSESGYQQRFEPRVYPDSSYIFQKHGLNTIAVGWEYFLGKVIQLSYKDEYLIIRDRVEDIPDIEVYDSLNIEIGNIYPYLMIPINIDIQGNNIQDNAIIDTGANSAIVLKDSLLNKYNIDFTDTHIGTAHSGGEGRKAKNIQLIADKVSIKNNSIIDCPISYSPSLQSFDSPILVGNGFWEKYSVVLDLENFVLYLRK